MQQQDPLALLLLLHDQEEARQDDRQAVMEAASEMEQASEAKDREAKLVEAERMRIDDLYKVRRREGQQSQGHGYAQPVS